MISQVWLILLLKLQSQMDQSMFKKLIITCSGRSRISRWGALTSDAYFLVKTYAKTKEIGPVGGHASGTPLDPVKVQVGGDTGFSLCGGYLKTTKSLSAFLSWFIFLLFWWMVSQVPCPCCCPVLSISCLCSDFYRVKGML